MPVNNRYIGLLPDVISFKANGTAPVNSVAPVISGIQIVSQTLSTTNGTWTGTPTIFYTYQWLRNGTNISGATNSNYTLVAADSGANIRCVVKGTNAFGNSSANSNTLAIIRTVFDEYSNGVSGIIPQLLRGAFYGSDFYTIRRSGDNAQANFGFLSNGLLNIASIEAFCIAGGGTKNGFIVNVYGQAVGDATYTQASAGKQAQIVNNGVCYVDANGLPNPLFTTGLLQEYTRSTSTGYSDFTLYLKNTFTSGGRGVCTPGVSTYMMYWDVVPMIGIRNVSTYYLNPSAIPTSLSKKTWSRNGNNFNFYNNSIVYYAQQTMISSSAQSIQGWNNVLFGSVESNERNSGFIAFNVTHSLSQISDINSIIK